MKYAAVLKQFFIVCAVVVVSGYYIVAAGDPMAGIWTGDGELNAAGQMRGKYVQTALENLKRMINVQNNAISQARDLNKKSVNKAKDTLQSLGKRLTKIQNKNS